MTSTPGTDPRSDPRSELSSEPAAGTGARRGRPGYDTATVLRICVDMFTKHGYDATSMGMLAERLGISKSAIYHHVPSKLDILRQALDAALDPLEEAFQQHLANPEPTALATLRALMAETIEVLIERRPYVLLLLRLRGNSEIEVAAMQRRRQLDRLTATIVEQAIAEGSIRGDLNPGNVARYMFGTINSLVEWLRVDDSMSTESAKRGVISLLFEGLETSRPTLQ